MTGEYKFFEKAGRYMTIIFLIWCVAYVLDRWVFKTHILVSCCSVAIAMFSAILFEFIVGFIFEVD